MKFKPLLLHKAIMSFVILFAGLQYVHAEDQNCELPDFAKLSKDVSPAVVNISTLIKPKQVNNPLIQYYGQQQIPLPELFRHFFDDQQPSQPQNPAPGQNLKPVPRSLGSGFIMEKDGYILTNYHVVKDADEIMVKLKDRREFKAKIIGSDKQTDIALLKIDTKTDLPTVTLGDSDKLEPGQWVFAIGSPFGFNYSVTKGIISALNRSLPNENFVPFIQTDVPINPGNSGGPLVSMSGKVIGINSQIYTRSGGFMGVSFAIPIDEAAYVAQQLKKNGKVVRGWLGVIFQDVDQKLSTSFGLKQPKGALVAQVIPNSPAAKSDIRPGDIILNFNNYPITFFSDLPIVIGRIPINTTVTADIWRDKKEITKKIEIEVKPDNFNNNIMTMTNNNDLGIKIVTLDDDYRRKLDLNDSITGVVITNVARNSLGESFNLKKMDVIDEINTIAIRNTKDFNNVINKIVKENKNKDDIITFRIIRDGHAQYMAFQFKKNTDKSDK